MKVLLIESHALLRIALRKMLEGVAAVDQVVAIDPVEIAAGCMGNEGIELVLLGLPEDADAGQDLLDKVSRIWSRARVLLLADTAPLNWPSSNWGPSVAGCLPKTVPLAVLDSSLRLVVSGYQVGYGQFSQRPAFTTVPQHNDGKEARWLEASAIAAPGPGNAASLKQDARMLGLTPRQYEVLMLLARGLPAKVISRRLNVSLATVKSHAAAIYRALRVRGKVEAVHLARKRGVQPEAVKGRALAPEESLSRIAIEISPEALVAVASDN